MRPDRARAADFARAADLAVGAGFDAVELHFSHSYLVSAFLSPRLSPADRSLGGGPRTARFAARWRGQCGQKWAARCGDHKLNMADGVRAASGWTGVAVARLGRRRSTPRAQQLLQNPIPVSWRSDPGDGAGVPAAAPLGFRLTARCAVPEEATSALRAPVRAALQMPLGLLRASAASDGPGSPGLRLRRDGRGAAPRGGAASALARRRHAGVAYRLPFASRHLHEDHCVLVRPPTARARARSYRSAQQASEADDRGRFWRGLDKGRAALVASYAQHPKAAPGPQASGSASCSLRSGPSASSSLPGINLGYGAAPICPVDGCAGGSRRHIRIKLREVSDIDARAIGALVKPGEAQPRRALHQREAALSRIVSGRRREILRSGRPEVVPLPRGVPQGERRVAGGEPVVAAADFAVVSGREAWRLRVSPPEAALPVLAVRLADLCSPTPGRSCRYAGCSTD
jgi:hypothetical protein